VLALNIAYDVHEDTSIETIIKFYDEKGVNYEKIWAASCENYYASHRRLANWNPADFEHIIVADKLYTLKDGHAHPVEGPFDSKAINEKDKLVLQNYGRPYANGKPSGGYYGTPKKDLLPDTFAK